MAIAVDFEGSNSVEKSVSGTAGDLPVLNFPHSSLSCWQLSADELEEVKKTGRVWVVTDTFVQGQLGPLPEGQRWQPRMKVAAHPAMARGW